MNTRIGIDVGGTYTDAVLIKGDTIVSKTKVPTNIWSLVETLISALDTLGTSIVEAEEITVSTTLVTNAIIQNRLPHVDLILLPGMGMRLDSLKWPMPYHILSGELDYRGREVSPPDELEWRRLYNKLNYSENGNYNVAIVGKFSHRNSKHEIEIANFFKKRNPDLRIALGHEWGKTNFYRRSQTTYLNLASLNLFEEFSKNLKQAIAIRCPRASIRVLKADGGVVSISYLKPVESIYSGPAASILGAIAQSPNSKSYVVIDIGGTTTDIGLVLNDHPLIASKGARIGSYSTNIRSLAVRSIPIGGDSAILIGDDFSDTDIPSFKIEDHRKGAAYCLGGTTATPTDAMRYLNLIEHGDYAKAEEGLSLLFSSKNCNPTLIRKLAAAIIESMTNRIANEIESLQNSWKNEPAYKVWEVLHPNNNQQFEVLVSGGGGIGIVASLNNRLNTKVKLVKHPEVSNAIGAAIARTTFSCTLHLDTILKRYRIEESGEQGDWLGSSKPYREVENFLYELAKKKAQDTGIDPDEFEFDKFDFFPIIQGWTTAGQIVQGAIHVPTGIIGRIR